MFAAPRDAYPRRRSASRSNDDPSSTQDRPYRLFHRHLHDPTHSSQSLLTTTFHHDDLPAPSALVHNSHTTSAQSTPMTSPSTAYSSLFPGSLSSATSESIPNPESQHPSEFGWLTPGASSPCSPAHGSTSSSSSYPLSPQSRSATESDSQASARQVHTRYHPTHLSPLPSTSFHSPPISPTASSTDDGPLDHHSRSKSSRLAVTIKNFLSKPVASSPSRFSFNSAATVPSDSDASPRSFHVTPAVGKWPLTPRKSRLPDLEIPECTAPATPNAPRTFNAQIDAHRRYASDAVVKIYNANMSSDLPISQESLDVPLRHVPPSPSVRGRDPKTRNVLRRRPSGSAKLLKGRERGMGSPSRPHQGNTDHIRLQPKDGMSCQGPIPFPLTAAGAVVEAYKQQELHCDDPPSLASQSTEDPTHSSALHAVRSSTPCYTVSGSSSERGIITSDSDSRQRQFDADQCAWTMSRATTHQPSMSEPSGRSLTRKVSTRWRKIKGGRGVPEESPSQSHDKGHSKGQPSLQETWPDDKSAMRSTGRSIDSAPNMTDGAWASPSATYARSRFVKGDGSEGGKLWQLMRRISTGGLRDRFQADKSVPPVPAIPKEILEKANQGEHSNGPLSPSHRQLSSSPSRTKARKRPSTAPHSSTVSHTAFSPSPNTTQAFHRTHSTRSSMSSYGEAVVISRVPEIVLDRRIIAPLEQLRLADGHVQNGESGASTAPVPRSPRRSVSVPTGLKTVEDAEEARLPLPSSHRQTCPGEAPSSGSSRPSSTSVSASGSARGSFQDRGLGHGGSRMEDGMVSLSPPPRPTRTSRRGGGGSVTSASSHSSVIKQVENGGGGGSGSGGIRQVDRMPSAQSDMTARYERPDSRRSRGKGQGEDQDVPTHANSQITFRELEGSRRPPLSEEEKAGIWDELLARSDLAGGTLHINGAAELMSDSISMRFSTQSGAWRDP